MSIEMEDWGLRQSLRTYDQWIRMKQTGMSAEQVRKETLADATSLIKHAEDRVEITGMLSRIQRAGGIVEDLFHALFEGGSSDETAIVVRNLCVLRLRELKLETETDEHQD